MAADTTTSPLRPDARFLLSHPAHFIALGFGAGLSPLAPGTAGTLLSALLALPLVYLLPPVLVAFLAIPLFFVGVWACGVTGRHLGVQDHGAMVWDEVVAFLPLAALAWAHPLTELLAFVLFRIFDIWKPFPIRELERRVKGGLGVMLDDVFAAFYAYAAFVVTLIIVYKALGYTR
jgi:phosphatidylglycerophosphatase A